VLRISFFTAVVFAISAGFQPASAQTTGTPSQSQGTALTPATPNLQDWTRHIVALFASNRQYPTDSHRAREEGVAMVTFQVAADGHVSAIRLSRTSGYPRLDQAAVDLVRRSSPLPPPPASVQTTPVTLPVRFSLRQPPPQAATGAPNFIPPSPTSGHTGQAGS
jgi:TonB family protein